MATTQAAMIMDTIMGMKRVLAQYEDSSDSDEPYLQPSNRGNKLKRKAQHMSGGLPVRKKGRETYTTNIEHAAYRRDILRRNPKRYDEDGDELDPEDEDEEADARANEENPYAEIHLQDLLAPLTSAANLAEHPSLSAPYLSTTLTDMSDHARETMHREKETLCNAKLLLRKMRGDLVWLPTEAMNTAGDEAIFDTEQVFNKIIAETAASRPIANSGRTAANGAVSGDATARDASGSTADAAADGVDAIAVVQQTDPVKEATDTLAPEEPEGPDAEEDAAGEAPDVNMTVEGNDADVRELPNQPDLANADVDPETDGVVGVRTEIRKELVNGTAESVPVKDVNTPADKHESPKEADTDMKDAQTDLESIENIKPDADPAQDGVNGQNDEPEAMEGDENETKPEPRRMTTRARANVASEPTISSHTASPNPPYVPPPIHPLFLLPKSAKPDADYGLPAPEAEETRRMLMVYVQKQEEVCRSAEKLYQNLLKADRQRKTVLRWSIAEGHVGEMSDGEDWCDKEEWGLDEDLRKGEGDEKEGDEATAGKKTRGRRV